MIALTAEQVAVVQSLFSSSISSYPAGYPDVQSIVQRQIAQNPGADNTDLEILANWTSNAATINADDGGWKTRCEQIRRKSTGSGARSEPVKCVEISERCLQPHVSAAGKAHSTSNFALWCDKIPTNWSAGCGRANRKPCP